MAAVEGESTSTTMSGTARVTASRRSKRNRSARKKTTSGCTTSYSSNTMSNGAATARPPDLRPYSFSKVATSSTAI